MKSVMYQENSITCWGKIENVHIFVRIIHFNKVINLIKIKYTYSKVYKSILSLIGFLGLKKYVMTKIYIL